MPPLRRSRRVPWYAWVFIVAWFLWSVFVLSHPIRGGTELPPPIWTEADLAPIPVEVASALGAASGKSDALRFLERHRSAEDALANDPAAAASGPAELFSTSVSCANSARSLTTYQVCVALAAEDLDSTARAVKQSRHGDDSRFKARISDLLQDVPALSLENSMIGEYVRSYQWLDSMRQDLGWKLLIITDLTSTVDQLNDAFRAASAEDACAKLEGIMPSPAASLVAYNVGGRNFLSSVELTFCTLLPQARRATEGLTEKRRRLLGLLGSDPQSRSRHRRTSE